MLAIGCVFPGQTGARNPLDPPLSTTDDTKITPSPSACDRDDPGSEIDWAPSLEEAMKRGQAENKPVLIAFSARRQELDFEQEF